MGTRVLKARSVRKMSRRTLTSLVRPVGGLFARSSASTAARVPAKTFARFASTNADEGDGLLYELDMDHFKLIENAVVQLKYASACAQLKPGEKKPPAPEIEDPVKEHVSPLPPRASALRAPRGTPLRLLPPRSTPWPANHAQRPMKRGHTRQPAPRSCRLRPLLPLYSCSRKSPSPECGDPGAERFRVVGEGGGACGDGGVVLGEGGGAF